MLLGFTLKVSFHNIETNNIVRRGPTATLAVTKAIESIKVQEVLAFRVALCTIPTTVNVDPSITVGAGLMFLIRRIVYVLAVEDL